MRCFYYHLIIYCLLWERTIQKSKNQWFFDSCRDIILNFSISINHRLIVIYLRKKTSETLTEDELFKFLRKEAVIKSFYKKMRIKIQCWKENSSINIKEQKWYWILLFCIKKKISNVVIVNYEVLYSGILSRSCKLTSFVPDHRCATRALEINLVFVGPYQMGVIDKKPNIHSSVMDLRV